MTLTATWKGWKAEAAVGRECHLRVLQAAAEEDPRLARGVQDCPLRPREYHAQAAPGEGTKRLLKAEGFEDVGGFGAGGLAEVDDQTIIFSVYTNAPVRHIISSPTLLSYLVI